MSETLKRVLVAVILVPVLILAVFSPHYHNLAYSAVLLLAGILMTLELLSIAEVKDIRTYKSITLPAIILIYLNTYFSAYYPNSLNSDIIIAIFLFSVIVLFLFETFQKDFSVTLEAVSVHVLTLLYCGVALTFIIKLLRVGGSESPYLGAYYFLYVWLITWITDSGAYFSGKYLGRKKLDLKASPNKTLEGFVGGVLTAVVSGVILKLILPDIFSESNSVLFSFPLFIAMTFFFALATIFGDLAESVMKRSSGVKDSKSYIPGHGGMLDVMDSLVYTAPIFYFLLFFTKS